MEKNIFLAIFKFRNIAIHAEKQRIYTIHA